MTHALNGNVGDVIDALKEVEDLQTIEEWLKIELAEQNRKGAKKEIRKKIRQLKREAEIEVSVLLPIEEVPAAADSEEVLIEEVPEPVVESPLEEPPETPKTMVVEIDSRPCTYRIQDCDKNGMAVCGVHKVAVCLTCSHDPSKPDNCRIICQEHGEAVQPVLNYGTHAAESTDPSGVEPMSVGAFDAEQ